MHYQVGMYQYAETLESSKEAKASLEAQFETSRIMHYQGENVVDRLHLLLLDFSNCSGRNCITNTG